MQYSAKLLQSIPHGQGCVYFRWKTKVREINTSVSHHQLFYLCCVYKRPDVLGRQVRSPSPSSWITFRPFSKSVHYFFWHPALTLHRHQQHCKMVGISFGGNVFKTSKPNHPLHIFVQLIIVVISYQLLLTIWRIKLYFFHSMHYP